MLAILAHMVGAVFLVNAIPHSVMGVSGRSFQSPFATPPGVGLSSPESNVLWGGINFLIGLCLLGVGDLTLGLNLDLALTLAAGWGCAFALARYFGRFHRTEPSA